MHEVIESSAFTAEYSPVTLTRVLSLAMNVFEYIVSCLVSFVVHLFVSHRVDSCYLFQDMNAVVAAELAQQLSLFYSTDGLLPKLERHQLLR